MLRYDKDKLRESLTTEDIIKLLRELGAENITDESESKGYITTNTVCHNQSGGTEKLYYYVESKSLHCYTDCSCSFDIYDLVIKNYTTRGINLSFSAAVDWVAQKSGKSFGFGFGFSEPVEKETDSELTWMNRFNKKKVELTEPPVYSDKILDVFSKNVYHPLFTNDNITPEVMDFYQISYYNREERIVIPYRHWKTGKLLGLRGRATRDWEAKSAKYLPITVQGKIYSFPSYSTLYSLYENKNTIKRVKKIIIFESEKSCLQCGSYFGIENNFSVALMGRNISKNQIDMILELGIEEVQIAMDKQFRKNGTSEEKRDIDFLLKMGRKFSRYVRTYVLFDKNNILEYKDSPSDKGKEVLMQMMREKQEIFNTD